MHWILFCLFVFFTSEMACLATANCSTHNPSHLPTQPQPSLTDVSWDGVASWFMCWVVVLCTWIHLYTSQRGTMWKNEILAKTFGAAFLTILYGIARRLQPSGYVPCCSATLLVLSICRFPQVLSFALHLPPLVCEFTVKAVLSISLDDKAILWTNKQNLNLKILFHLFSFKKKKEEKKKSVVF